VNTTKRGDRGGGGGGKGAPKRGKKTNGLTGLLY